MSAAIAGSAGIASAQAPLTQPAPGAIDPTIPPPPDTNPALVPAPAPQDVPVTAPVGVPGATPTTDAVPAPPALPPAPVLIPDGQSPPGPVAPAFPPAIPNLDYGARMRIGVRLQDPTDPKSFGDISQQIDTDIYFAGQIHRFFKWQAGVTVSYSGNTGQAQTATVLPLDLLARFEPLPAFNIYLGRMIVVADRYTPSGPWGMDEFFYPGVFSGTPLAPAVQRSGSTGRDLGANIWGAFLGGHIKYYLGFYQFHDPSPNYAAGFSGNPLLSGRLQVSLLTPEPAFYQRTTYYGDRDLVSIGFGGQHQADGSFIPAAAGTPTMPAMTPTLDDYSMFTADLTIDKRLGDSGTLSVYGGFSKYSGDFQPYDSFWHAAVGFTFPGVIGIGKLRPNVRYQHVTPTNDAVDSSGVLDVQLSYLIMNWFARVNIGYRRGMAKVGGMGAPAGGVEADSNMLWLGVVLADP